MIAPEIIAAPATPTGSQSRIAGRMKRKNNKTDVVRALFARSGNQCAYPGCTQPLMNHLNQFIGQIGHIEAASPGGQRYNSNQTDEDRRAYGNLQLLCYPHHVESNLVDDFPVERLQQIKRQHEASFEKSDFKIDESALYNIVSEMDRYWTEIDRLYTHEHVMKDLAPRIDVGASYRDLVNDCKDNMASLSSMHVILEKSDESLHDDFENLLLQKKIDVRQFEDVPYSMHPFQNRNWEYHNIGIPNCMDQLEIDLIHMEIKYLEEFLKTNSRDSEANERLQKLKLLFAEIAQQSTMID